MEDRRYYRSLTRNMAVIMIMVSVTPLILIAGLIGYYFETAYREKVLAHLQELVEKHQQNINSFLDEKLSYIKVLADSYSYEQLSDEAFLENKLVILQNAYSGIFVDIGIVDSAGVQIAYAGNLKLERADYSGADWFHRAQEQDYFISDVFLGLRKTPHFIVSVKKRRGESEWLLRATIDFLAFNSLVENLRIGKTGAALIVNSAGEFQTHPRTEPPPEMFSLLKRTSWARPVPAGESHTAANQAVKIAPVRPEASEADSGPDAAAFRAISSGSLALSGIVDSRDRKLIYILMPLKGGEWTLAYQQDVGDAFSEVNSARTLALTILFSGALGIIFMALFLSRKVVSRIEKADQEKDIMNEQVLEAGKMASVGELAAGIAHEINNPVAIMAEEAGWMEDLLQDLHIENSEDAAEFKRSLKQITVQGERCKEITHKLLSFARRTDPVHRDIQVNDTIEEILGIFDQRSKFNNIRIQSELDPDLPLVSASPTELQQVFINLINNAIDAMGSRGGLLEIRSRLEGDHAIIDIADTGHGIPSTVMARVFEPFFTTKPVGKGTGLGLSICYGIVKKLGGKITVDSAVGLGTTFHISLPVRAANAARTDL